MQKASLKSHIDHSETKSVHFDTLATHQVKLQPLNTKQEHILYCLNSFGILKVQLPTLFGNTTRKPYPQ